MQSAQIERLAHGHEVRGHQLTKHLVCHMGIASRDQRERVERLVAHLGRLHVVDGVGQETELGGQGRDVDIGAFEDI